MRWQRSHMDDWFCRTVAGFPHSHSGLEFLGDALTFLLFFIGWVISWRAFYGKVIQTCVDSSSPLAHFLCSTWSVILSGSSPEMIRAYRQQSISHFGLILSGSSIRFAMRTMQR